MDKQEEKCETDPTKKRSNSQTMKCEKIITQTDSYTKLTEKEM